jgi:hypothetical protein
VQIKLLEAGAEPRKTLRWHPKAGDKQKLGIATKLAMGMKVGEMENPPMKMPGMKLTMELTVKEISAEGLITYDTVISEAGVVEGPDVIPQFAATIKSAMDSIKGMSGTGMMSNRGESKGIEFKVPADAEPQARQTIDQMKEIMATLTTPLPEEAIGLGAKWEARTKVKSQGMSIDQTTTYQLVSMEGERATVKSALAQQATNQKIENPAMPGLKVDMTKMEGKGSGNIVCDFAQLLPVSGTIESHSDALMAMDLGAQKQVMNMKMDVTINLESK